MAGISVVGEMYHHDMPTSYYNGWSHPDIVAGFVTYASACIDELSPYVTHWITIANPYEEVHHIFLIIIHS